MTISTADLDYIRELVCHNSGNVISPQHGYLLERRLAPVLESTGIASMQDLVRELRQNLKPKLKDQVVEAMTINETSFFRDIHPFDALREVIVPQLSQKRAAFKTVNIWCAACSSGQEPYSIAMLLREHFSNMTDWNFRITATDLSDAMLAKCREGVYSQFEVNRGLPARLLVKYFERHGPEWRVKPDVRKMIDFRKLNLTQTWPIAQRFDVVFLRNVLIYFDKEKKQEILSRIHRSLQPDGYLILGGGETLINLATSFGRVEVGQTVCFQPTT